VDIRKAWKGKEWTATFGGYHMVTAPTKAKARELAYKTMEEMVSGDYRARVLLYGNQTAVMYREPAGWVYSISPEDGDGRVAFGSSCHTSQTNGDEVERNVRSHMAQTASVTGTGLTDHSAFILNDEDREEYQRWLRWQRAVRAALDAGHDMEQAREIADRARYAA
jgi:hypothetical protein